MDRLSRRLFWGSIACAVLLHFWLIGSIVGQPFNVQKAPPQARSVTWALSNDSAHRLGPFADFLAVYNAGLAYRNGLDFYTKRVMPGVPYFYVYRYLPVVGYSLGAALSFLPPREASLIWVVLLEGLLAGFLLLFWRTAGHPWIRLLAVIVLLLSTPYFLEVHMGQFTFGTLCLTAMALLLLEESPGVGAGQADTGRPAARPSGATGRFTRNRIGLTNEEIAAVVLYSLAVLMKVFPLVIAPVLLRRGRAGWFCVLVAGAALAVFNVPYFLQHPATWGQYLDRNFSPGAVWDGLNPGNFGLVYMLHLGLRELGVSWSDAGWVAFVQIWRWLILAPAAFLVLFSRRNDLLLGSALMILAHFATFHHVWEHHWSGILPIGLLVLWRTAGSRRVWGSAPRTKDDAPTASAARDAASGPSAAREEAAGSRALHLTGILLLLWAMPSPSVFFDRLYCPPGLDPYDTWPVWARLITPAFKVVPMVILLVRLIPPFWRAGLGWPWSPAGSRRSRPDSLPG